MESLHWSYCAWTYSAWPWRHQGGFECHPTVISTVLGRLPLTWSPGISVSVRSSMWYKCPSISSKRKGKEWCHPTVDQRVEGGGHLAQGSSLPPAQEVSKRVCCCRESKNNNKTKYYCVLEKLNNGRDKTLLPPNPSSVLCHQLVAGFHGGPGCCPCHFGWCHMWSSAGITRASERTFLFSSSPQRSSS